MGPPGPVKGRDVKVSGYAARRRLLARIIVAATIAAIVATDEPYSTGSPANGRNGGGGNKTLSNAALTTPSVES
jgi:hypothetical protein